MNLLPIEKAPKVDDELLLLYGTIDGEVYGVRDEPQFAVGRWYKDCWLASPTEYYAVTIYPTHYIPLPNAPEKEQKQ